MKQFPAAKNSNDSPPEVRGPYVKLLLGVVMIVAVAGIVWKFGDQLTLSQLAKQEVRFQQFQNQNPVLTLCIAFAFYVGVTGLSLPGAAAMTLLFAWLLGFWPGLITISLASTTGAVVAFLLSRYFLRDVVARHFGKQLDSFNQALQADGPFYLFTLRLIPAVPFFVINAVMGLTQIRVSTFWWVSQLGMLPGTMVYVYAGSRVPTLQQLADKGVNSIFSAGQMIQILIALALLGLLPWVGRKIVRRFQASKSP